MSEKLQERITEFLEPIKFSKLERTQLDAVQFCAPEEQEAEPYPVGFFKALTRSGLDAEMGFYCDKCHVVIQCGLVPGNKVKHCKTTAVVPHPTNRTETRRIGEFKNVAQTTGLRFVQV
jgi:hypothetical protein